MFVSLRTKIITAFFLIFSFIACGFTLFHYFLEVKYLKASQLKMVENMSGIYSREVSGHLADQLDLVDRISKGREFEEYYLNFRDVALIRYFQRFSILFEEIDYVDADGQEVVGITNGQPCDKFDNVSSREEYKKALLEPNKAFVSPVVYNNDLQKYVLRYVIERHQYFGDKFIGTFVAQESIENFFYFLKNSRIGSTGYVVVVDTQGRILYSPWENKLFHVLEWKASSPGIDPSDGIFFKHYSGQASMSGTPGLLASVPIENTDWLIMAFLPQQEVMLLPNKVLKIGFLTGIGLFLLTLVIVIVLSRYLTLPLVNLEKAISKISEGSFFERVKVKSNDEIGILGSAFNKMTENLQMTMVSKEYVENIIERMSDALLVFNVDLKIFMANNAAVGLTGYSLKELSGMPLRTILPEEIYLEFSRQIKMNPQGQLTGLDTYCLTKDGSKIPVIFNFSVVHDNDGAVLRIICNIKDIRERKEAEKELRDAYERLKELQSHLVQTEKMAAIGQLAGGVAHEINNPLTGVLNNVQLIKMMTENSREIKVEEFKDLLDTIEESALRCKKITESLLDFSRASMESYLNISLNTVIEKVVGLIDVEIRLQNIVLTKNLKMDLPLVKGDSQLLQQVVIGLITNAKWAIEQKFNKNPGGMIAINTEYVSDMGLVKLLVIDNGSGIPESQIKKIFEPFFTTKPVGQGTGLGLAVIYNIIKKHKGTIVVKSKENEGTTFQIFLPVAK